MKKLLLIALFASQAWAAIAFKSITSTSNAASATTIANGTSVNVATNDLIVVVVSHGNNIANATGVACGSNTLTRATSSTYATENFGIELWYKEGAVAGATTTCTATWAAAQIYRTIIVALYTGAATSSALDQTSCNVAGCNSTTTDATNRTAQNVTTTQAGEVLVWASVEWQTHNWTPANSFTERLGASGTDLMLSDRVVASTGTYPSGNVETVTDAVDDKYLAVFATFKDSSGGGGGTVRRRVIVVQ
jgi:hypothetical protein